MQMTLADRSNYFKGLLLLARKDKVLADEEKAMLLRLGELLQYNRDFCEQTIYNLLTNPHLDEIPPTFSNKECTELFLLDGIKIAFADHNLHKKEYTWMQEIAMQNDISSDWLTARLADFLNGENGTRQNNFEIENFVSQRTVALPLPA